MSEAIIGLALLLMVGYFIYLTATLINRRAYAVDFYRDTVAAYKVAYIKDKAEKAGFELIYPTKEGMSNLKGTVDKDLEKDVE